MQISVRNCLVVASVLEDLFPRETAMYSVTHPSSLSGQCNWSNNHLDVLSFHRQMCCFLKSCYLK